MADHAHKPEKPAPTFKEALPGLILFALIAIVAVSCISGGNDDKKPGDKSESSAVSQADNTKARAEAAAQVKADVEAAEARKAAAAERQKTIDEAQFPSERDLALVFKDPDQRIGEIFQVWGSIRQFDAATGSDAFLADTANRNITSYGYFNGENALFSGSASDFEDFVEDDLFIATVEVAGSMSYDTQIGGNTTVPHFTVLEIARQ